MAAPALFRDTADGGVKRFATGRETTMNIQGIEPLATGTAVALFDTVTAGVTMFAAVAADNDVVIGPSGNQIIIDNTTGSEEVRITGDFRVVGSEIVETDAEFKGDTTIGDAATDTLTVNAVSTFNADATFGDSTTGGDTFTFGGGGTNPANVDFGDAEIISDITFDGTAQAVTNDGANLTVSTTTSGNLLLTGADNVNVTTGTTAGDNFTVNTDALYVEYVDGTTDYVVINGTAELPAGNGAPLTVNHGTADKPVITLHSGAVTETSILTGSTDPSGGAGVPAPRGSLYMLNTGSLYVKTNTGDTNWSQIGTTAGSTLQAAYDASSAPATIAMATSKDLVFQTNETGASESDFLVEQSGGNDYLLCDAANDRIDLGSTNIPIRALNDITMAGATPLITADSVNLTVSTTTSGHIILDTAGAVGIGTTSPQANDMLTVAHNTDKIVALNNTGDSSVVELCSGTDPTGVTAWTGSLYLEYDGTTGANAKLWINQSDGGSGTVWTDITTTATSLQDAYENGNTVALASAEGDWQITVDEASTYADWVLTGASGQYLASDAQNTKIILGSSGIGIDAANDITMTGTTPLITTDTATLSLTTTTSGDIIIDSIDNFVATTNGDTSDGFLITSAGLTAVNGKDTQDVEIRATGVGGSITVTSADTSAGALNITATGTGGGIVIDADTLLNVDATNIDMDATGASAFTVTGANLTLETVTSGDVDINSAAAVDIDSATFDVLTSGAFSIDGTGASNVSAASGTLTLSTTTSGDVAVTSAANIPLTASSGAVTISSGTAEVMSILTGTNDPTSVATSANAGSLFLRDDTSTGEVYVKQDDGSSTNWLQLATINEVGDVVMTALSLAEAFTIGDVLYMDTTGAVGKASGDSTETAKARPLGICLTDNTVGTAGNTIRIALAGEVVINSAVAAASEGKYLYLSDTAGALVLTPPSGSGDTVIRCGVCTVDGIAGTAKMAISFGEPTLL